MSVTYEDPGAYQFGEFTLDAARGELHRASRRVPLRPKSFDVLHYLVTRPGQLVTREELLDAVWAGSVVTDESVTQCLIDIRKALGDSAHAVIRTVPKRGYIFEMPVENAPATAAKLPHGEVAVPARRNIRWQAAAAAVIAAIAVAVFAWLPGPEQAANPPPAPADADSPTHPSIAILPFESMSQDAGRTFFAEGVSEEIISSLARQQDLKVIARTSSFAFRGQNLAIPEIAAKLKVSHVLEGSVRDAGNALRINVQLVDAGTGEYVWTEQFDRELSATTVFAIQTEIATAVVQSLQSELSPEERARLVRVPTRNMQALEDYFAARQLMETRRPVDLDRANELLQRAVTHDPEFALAYVALADTLRLQSNYGSLDYRQADDQGIKLARKALSIDDRLGEAHATLGNIQTRRGDYQAAESSFLRGIELNPNYAPLYQWYGQFLWANVARPDESVAYSRIAAALDPRSAIINTDYAAALAAAGHFDEALAQLDLVHDIDPAFARAYVDRASILHMALGRIDEAIPFYERARALSPQYAAPLLGLAGAYIDLERPGWARELLEASAIRDNASLTATDLHVKVISGDTESALRQAQAVLDVWPWHVETLRFLRDHALERAGVDAALDLYRPVFSALLGEAPGVVGPSNFAVAIDVAYLLTLNGRHDRADTLLNEALPFIEGRPRRTWFGTPLADVRIAAIRGDHDAALARLQAAVDEGWRLSWQFELEHDAALAELRQFPEYAAALQTIRDDIEQQRERVDSAITPAGRNQPRTVPER